MELANGDLVDSAPAVTMPMFPLGTVLFPYALLPLHVFEPRYRLMMRHVLEGDHEFGVVLIERGNEVGGGDTRFDVATVARVVQAAELPDGRYVLATVGMRRVGVRRWLADDPYPRAEVVALDDPPRASYEAAAVAPIGPLDAQRLLATRDAGARLALLADLVEERVVDLRAGLDLDE